MNCPKISFFEPYKYPFNPHISPIIVHNNLLIPKLQKITNPKPFIFLFLFPHLSRTLPLSSVFLSLSTLVGLSLSSLLLAGHRQPSHAPPPAAAAFLSSLSCFGFAVSKEKKGNSFLSAQHRHRGPTAGSPVGHQRSAAAARPSAATLFLSCSCFYVKFKEKNCFLPHSQPTTEDWPPAGQAPTSSRSSATQQQCRLLLLLFWFYDHVKEKKRFSFYSFIIVYY